MKAIKNKVIARSNRLAAAAAVLLILFLASNLLQPSKHQLSPFATSIAKIKQFKTTREKALGLLSLVPLVDTHNDFPGRLSQFFKNKISSANLTSLPSFNTDLTRLRKGRVGAQFWSAYVPCQADYLQKGSEVTMTMTQIDLIKRMVTANLGDFQFATTTREIWRSFRDGKIASLVGVEGGHSVDSSLDVLRGFYDLGVRYLTLTHTCHVSWADSCSLAPVHNGLTEFGKTVIREMNRLGMAIDISHVSQKTMQDAIDVSTAPIIFSHSSSFTLCPNSRNVPDNILSALHEKDGVVMVNFYNGYITCGMNATLEDVADHIEYIAKVAGVDKVGFGSDFDGVNELPVGLEDVSKYPDLVAELLRRKWSEEDVLGVIGMNFLRVFEKIEMVGVHLRGGGVAVEEDLFGTEKHC